jgi:hypothetical protein
VENRGAGGMSKSFQYTWKITVLKRTRQRISPCSRSIWSTILHNIYLETNETTATAMQWRRKYTSIKIELLLEKVFSMWSVPKSYLEDNWGDTVFVNYNLVDSQPLKRRLEVGVKRPLAWKYSVQSRF